MRELRFWATLKTGIEKKRVIRSSAPHGSLHSDATELGSVETRHTEDMNTGVAGMWVDQGVWNWHNRANRITLREFKAIRKILMGALGENIKRLKTRDLLMHVDHNAVVHITNSFVRASREMIRELRKHKVVLDRLGLRIRSEWLPSALNRYVDALSLRLPKGDLWILRSVRSSITDEIQQGRDVFPYRLLGEPPIAARKKAFKELEEPWDTN